MSLKNNILLVLTILLGSHLANSQEQYTLSTIQEKKLNAKELDSFLIVVRDYFYEGSYEKVIEITPSLIKQADSLGESITSARLNSALGNAFIQLDDTESAEKIFTTNLNKYLLKKDMLGILSTYINLGNTHIKGDSEKAIEYFEQGLRLSKDNSKNAHVAYIAHNNLAELYIGIEDASKAEFHVNEAEKMIDLPELGTRKQEYKAVINYIKGAIALLNNQPQKAVLYGNKALNSGLDKTDENYLIENYKTLISAHDKLGNYKEINQIRKDLEPLLDKRYEQNKIKQQQIAKSKFYVTQYEQELRASQLENELALQKAEKNNLQLKAIYLVAIILLVLLGTLLFARYKKNKLLQDLKAKNQQYLEAKEQSENLSKKNTQFLSTISHELRTPLYGIIGLSSVFLKDPKFKDYSEDLNSLKFSADYLLSLVNDVLNLNKFSSIAGKKNRKSYFKMEHLIRSICQNFEFLNRKNNNDISITIASDVPRVIFTDKTKLSQVLINLISNACKFTEDGKINIVVNTKEKSDNKAHLSFTIKDTGKGIPKEEQANIFNEITQVQDHRDQDGTGLGLPIVNKILTTLDSKLEFFSELDKGSEFSFDIWTEIGNDTNLTTIESSDYEKLKSKNILIVDDNKINQVVTQKVLEQYKMLHATASNGKEAIEMASKVSYDAILMDINMPIMNGMQSSEQIREFNTDTPIIALTATDYNKEKNELCDYGINNFIVKPYKTEDLLEILVKHIA